MMFDHQHDKLNELARRLGYADHWALLSAAFRCSRLVAQRKHNNPIDADRAIQWAYERIEIESGGYKQ